jgi:DNA-directed RNA polymerase subunit F
MNLSLSTQPTNRANFTPETINELTIALKAKPYKLLAAEILQILNHVPRNTTELSMLLEEAEERFPEEKLEAIVGIIDKILAKS